MDTSHNSYTRISGNVAEFIFKTINLDSGGHGNVLFKIKTLNSLSGGDMVNKRADIFFDYNFPIVTNDAVTTFAILSSRIFTFDESVSVSPNPAASIIKVSAKSDIKSIELFDVQGRIIETAMNIDKIDVSDKTNGIYFLKITTDNGSKIEKIIKE